MVQLLVTVAETVMLLGWGLVWASTGPAATAPRASSPSPSVVMRFMADLLRSQYLKIRKRRVSDALNHRPCGEKVDHPSWPSVVMRARFIALMHGNRLARSLVGGPTLWPSLRFACRRNDNASSGSQREAGGEKPKRMASFREHRGNQ